MNKDFDLNEVTSTVKQLAEAVTKTQSVQILKKGIDEVLQGVTDVLDKTSKNMNTFEEKSSKKPHIYNIPPTMQPFPKHSVSGILLTIFGSIGTVLSGITTTVFSLLSINVNNFFTIGATISGILLAASALMLFNGCRQIKKHKRFSRYRKRIGTSPFCPLELLSQDVGKGKPFVIRELKEMRIRDYLQDIYFDKAKTCVILDNITYQHYQESMIKKISKRQPASKPKEILPPIIENKELSDILAKGQQQLSEIKNLSRQISGSDFPPKIKCFHKLTAEIFTLIQQEPSKLEDIRKVHDYYLPTVIKLLTMYVKLDTLVEETQNIKTSKKEIEDVMDTLNNAFKELLDNLFDNDALDITTDISVLYTMLAQEGLVGNDDFKK